MSGASYQPTGRGSALLAERVLCGLSPSEERELEQLLEGDYEEACASWDLTAAALHLAFLRQALEPLPAALFGRLVRTAGERLGEDPQARESDD